MYDDEDEDDNGGALLSEDCTDEQLKLMGFEIEE